MAIAAVSSANSATNAFGLEFQSLLKIILTQLTYQDPLKPVDNFQFVSQLGQFAQLQQTQTLNDQITSLLSAQATSQATSLLGRTVDATSGSASAGITITTGVVQAVSFSSGRPEVTIKTSGGAVVANVAIANITQVR